MSLVAQPDNAAHKLPVRLILLGGMDTEGDCCTDDAWILNVDETKWAKVSVTLGVVWCHLFSHVLIAVVL